MPVALVVNHPLVMGFLVGAVVTWLFEITLYLHPVLREEFWDNPLTFFGYHVHHSVVGLVCLGWGFFSYPESSLRTLFLIGLGVGVIVIHSLGDGFVFIERFERIDSDRFDR